MTNYVQTDHGVLQLNFTDLAGTMAAAQFAGTATNGYVLELVSGVPTWTASATSATTATNLSGGAAGTIHYQTGSGTTSTLAIGTAGQILQVNVGATAPSWVTPASGSTFANPTGTIGLTAVNGSATTLLRSDGAPALSQAIAPTWTGLHLFTGYTGSSPSIAASGVFLGNLSSASSGTYPTDVFVAHGSTTNNRVWRSYVDETAGTAAVWQCMNDAFSTPGDIGFTLTRSANAITEIDYGTGNTIHKFGGTVLIGNGTAGSYSAPQLTIETGQYGIGVDATGSVFFKNTNNGNYYFTNSSGSATLQISQGNVTIPAPASGTALTITGASSATALTVTGPILANSAAGSAQFVMNSVGADYGYIGNPSSQVWALGWGAAANIGTLGTSVLTWNNTGVVSLPAYGAGSLSTNSSGVISASDGRYKTKTRSLVNGLALILSLTPTYYKWHDDSPFAHEYEELGFIAQEVAAVIPEASPEPEHETKFKNYHDRAIIAALVKAVQELSAELSTLKAKVGE
jgi:hypothetical protein